MAMASGGGGPGGGGGGGGGCTGTGPNVDVLPCNRSRSLDDAKDIWLSVVVEASVVVLSLFVSSSIESIWYTISFKEGMLCGC